MSLPEQMPARLEEAARDGSERAGGALSSLLGRTVGVQHRGARVVRANGDATQLRAGSGAAIGRLTVESGNELHGSAVVAMSASSVRELLATYDLPLLEDGMPDEDGLSMLREVSNITASSYLNALADAWDVELLPSPVEVLISGSGDDVLVPDNAGSVPALLFQCEFTSDHGAFEVSLVTCIDTSRIPLFGATR